MTRIFAPFAAAVLAVSTAMSPAVAPLAAQTAPDTSPDTSLANVQLTDPDQEQAATELMETLRCLTCQSQSIADSDAEMAEDMRHLVRTRVQAGETPEEIRGWLVERYGDYVSYSPDADARNWPLYAIPALLLLIGLALFVRRLRGTS